MQEEFFMVVSISLLIRRKCGRKVMTQYRKIIFLGFFYFQEGGRVSLRSWTVVSCYKNFLCICYISLIEREVSDYKWPQKKVLPKGITVHSLLSENVDLLPWCQGGIVWRNVFSLDTQMDFSVKALEFFAVVTRHFILNAVLSFFRVILLFSVQLRIVVLECSAPTLYYCYWLVILPYWSMVILTF